MDWDHVQSVKEVARDVVHRTGLSSILYALRQRRGFKTSHLDEGTVAERSTAIYRDGAWVHSQDQASGSGMGSELTATAHVRVELPRLLADLGCRTLLDVGCGDWNWMRHVDLPCDYLGIDVVPEVIDRNRQFEREGVAFRLADAIAGPLPTADAATSGG